MATGARRALIVWEIGGGRGHIVHLGAIAAALRHRGFSNSAHLVEMEHAAEIAAHCDSVQGCAPLRRYASEGHWRSSTRYGDWLGRHRFDDPAALRQAIDRWRATMEKERPSVLVAEQSPTAILAARSLGIAVAHIGVPVTAPPAEMSEYPPFLDDGGPLQYREAALLGAVNEAIAAYGMAPLAALPAVYTADDEIVASIDLLDRYDAWRQRPRVPPVMGGWQEPGERLGAEVFVYLSTTDRSEPAILTAIATLDLPTRVVIAGNPLPGVTVARWRKATVEARPLPPAEITRQARVLVHAGNHGISCLGLRAGLPQVTLSHQYEHIYDGRQISAAGAGTILERRQWTVPAIHRAIHDAWSNAAMSHRARTLAGKLAPQFEGDPGEMTADRIEAVIR